MDNGDSLSARAAEEIRAMLGRKRVTGRELARRLDVSSPWVSQRLTGHTEIGLNDLQRIAQALEVEIADLLPLAARSGQRTNIPSPTSPGRPMPERRKRVRFQHRHLPHPADPRRDPPVTSRTGATRPVIKPWAHVGAAT